MGIVLVDNEQAVNMSGDVPANLKNYWEAFQKADKNGDGKLDFEEFKQYVALLDAGRTDASGMWSPPPVRRWWRPSSNCGTQTMISSSVGKRLKWLLSKSKDKKLHPC